MSADLVKPERPPWTEGDETKSRVDVVDRFARTYIRELGSLTAKQQSKVHRLIFLRFDGWSYTAFFSDRGLPDLQLENKNEWAQQLVGIF